MEASEFPEPVQRHASPYHIWGRVSCTHGNDRAFTATIIIIAHIWGQVVQRKQTGNRLTWRRPLPDIRSWGKERTPLTVVHHLEEQNFWWVPRTVLRDCSSKLDWLDWIEHSDRSGYVSCLDCSGRHRGRTSRSEEQPFWNWNGGGFRIRCILDARTRSKQA